MRKEILKPWLELRLEEAFPTISKSQALAQRTAQASRIRRRKAKDETDGVKIKPGRPPVL